MDPRSNFALLPPLARRTPSRILYVVLDGLGGVIGAEPTALERARHPHLDALARDSALGRQVPVAEGITPGSGPGHLALFGYDPVGVPVGRGLLEALGVGATVGPGDVAVRGNYCTLDAQGLLVDRRAGRLPTPRSRALTTRLAAAIPEIEGVRVEVLPGLQHRFALVLRGDGLGAAVADTDPQQVGVAPLAARATDAFSARTARLADRFVEQARALLAGEERANGVLLRGFGSRPSLPTLAELARLTPVAIAPYPAYRGVARLLGMHVLDEPGPGADVAAEVDALERVWDAGYDFFFLHVKGTDSAGEDGDEERKAGVIEEFDAQVPRLRALGPDVIVITGDHSTPGPLAGHSWHPVPVLLHGPWCEPDGMAAFDEVHCHRGRLGPALPAPALLRLALANAGKLGKYGA